MGALFGNKKHSNSPFSEEKATPPTLVCWTPDDNNHHNETKVPIFSNYSPEGGTAGIFAGIASVLYTRYVVAA